MDGDSPSCNGINDTNIVSWDGPGDPMNPRNWSKARKSITIALVSLSVLYCNLATTMFAPGANLMAAEFNLTNQTVMVLCITISSLGFALGPLVVAPLSEAYGRLPIYRTSAVLYMAFTVACARSTHVNEFIVFRFLTGCAAASYMTCGGGTIADILPKEERGAAMAMFTAGPLLGPVVGPIVGGFVTQDVGWRWTFYLVLILAGIVTIAAFILMRESSAAVILANKAARLRKETGNSSLHAINDEGISIQQRFVHVMFRPLRMLLMSPVVLVMALYMAVLFAMVMLLFATFPLVFEETYRWSVGVSGLAYLGLGAGAAIGLFVFGKVSDALVGSSGKQGPETRLILMMWFSPTVPIGFFWYGWTTHYGVHWIVPIIGTGFIGLGVPVITASAQTYAMDMFGPEGAASALAAITLLRNATGSFLPLAAPSLYQCLGLGWGNSVLAFIAVAFIPVPFVFYWRGEWLRNKFIIKI